MNKQINSLALLAIASASIMSSCSKDTDLYDSNLALKEYEQSWTEKFGQVASDQDWNTATRANVTVNTASATEVKVYSVSDDTYTLVGDFEGVSGTQKLEFDIAKGVTKLMVNTPSTSFMTTVGGTVDFGGTKSRASHPGTTGIITVSDMPSTSDITLTAEDAKVYTTVLPEGTDNRGNVTKNFKLISSGEIVVYPIYWQTNQTLTLGVYYYDDNGTKQEVDVYTTKDTDASTAKLLIEKSGVESWPKYQSGNYPEWLQNIANGIDFSNITDQNKADVKAAFENFYGSSATIESVWIYSGGEIGAHIYGTEWTYANNNGRDVTCSMSDKYTGKVLSKGIKVEIPENTVFGMYVRGDQTYYSEESLNTDSYFDKAYGTAVEGKHACHAAIYKVGDTRYLGFEDWYNSYDPSAMDLNDLIVKIEGVNDTKIVDKDKETSQSWILACEDLGSTDDYDFNDVVFEVSHVAGKNTATITPLAAGGTLKAEIYNGTTLIGEVHDLLVNGTTAESGSYPVLNAGPQKSGYYVVDRSSLSKGGVKSVTLGVDQTFTMANVAGDSKTNMGGFWVKVYKEGETTESVSINAPTNGSVPQMLCISGDLNWAWPIEGTGIEKAYTKFSDWVENTSDSDWYKTPNEVK